MNDSLKNTKWILVAGSGAGQIPARIVETSERVGRELAQAGFGLISGGWSGVDHMTARAFAMSVKEGGGALTDRVLQVMKEGETPDFPGGLLRIGGTEAQAWTESIRLADGIILIGGLGGTQETGRKARQMGKAVFPLADSKYDGHLDAYDFYFQMVNHWNTDPIQGLPLAEFHYLADPAPGVVTALIQLLEKLFGRQAHRRQANQIKQRPPLTAALELWQEKLEYMLMEEATTVDPAMKFRLKKLTEEAEQQISLLRGRGALNT